MLSRRVPSSSLKHDRRTGNGTRSLRRRPFLIFDRTEAKGYKRLNHRAQPQDTSPPSSYRPGDGFSGREAKPNGSNLLTQNGKQSAFTGPHVGILDLTQSEPPPEKKKRRARRINMDDNSFMPPPKKTKQGRRPLGPKDPNQQLKPSTTISNPGGKTKTAHIETDTTATEPTVQETAVTHVRELNQPQDPNPAANTSQVPQSITDTRPTPHPATALQTGSNQDPAPQVPTPSGGEDVAMIERSDDPPHEPSGLLGDTGIHDSFETQVSSTPPRTLRIRALSVSPSSPSPWAGEGRRDFRRVNTQ